MTISVSSLLLAGTALVVYNRYIGRENLINEMNSTALLIADRSTAAISFNDALTAAENLAALKMKSSVISACILDEEGNLIAGYPEGEVSQEELAGITTGDWHTWEGQRLATMKPVKLENAVIGYVYIIVSLSEYAAQQYNILIIVLASILFASLIALVLALRLHNVLTGPILNLTETAKDISKRADYSLRAVESSTDEIGEMVHSFNEMLDVINNQNKERRKLINDLKESKSIINTILDTIPQAIFWKDKEGYYLGCNKSFARLAGIESEDTIIGKTAYDIPWVNDGYKDLLNSDISVALTSQTSHHEVRKFVDTDGSIIWLDAKTIPLRDTGGVVIMTLEILEDITERKISEEKLEHYRNHLEDLVQQRTAELEKEKERAESADRLKSAFLATMSHELRTPLNSIIGFTGILMQERPGPLNPEQKKQLGMAQGSARHLLSLINDVLDISKIEAGQLNVHPEKFSLPEVIQKVVEHTRPMAQKKNLAVYVEIQEGLDGVFSDKLRIQQILINLVSNAIKFTDEGSVTITAREDEKFVRVSVKDTGIGIEESKIGQLFKPFIQIDTGLTRKHEGTGLGLSICRKLLTLLGGTITAESSFGQGSTFSFTIPVSEG